MLIEHVLNENTVVDSRTVLDMVQDIHGRPDDLEEGDLVHRINKFDTYEKTIMDIDDLDLDEWEVDEDFVEELSKRIEKEGYQPIVYDPDDGSIIDGIHRANALHTIGKTKIKAYVGKDIDPYWGEDDEDED